MPSSRRSNADQAHVTTSSTAEPSVESGPSIFLWLPLVWYFIVSSRALSAWMTGERMRGVVGPEAAEGNPADRLLLTALIFIGGLILANRREVLARVLSANRWLLVLFLYIFLSALWSYFPDVTFRRAIRSVGTCVMVLLIFTESKPLDSLVTVLRRTYIVHMVLSLIAIRYFRNIGVSWSYDGREEEWIGLAVHKNNLGQVAMSSGLFFVWLLLNRSASKMERVINAGMLLLTLYLLKGSGTSHSTTAILGFVVGVCVLLTITVFRKQVVRGARPAMLIGASVLVLALAAYGVASALGAEPFDAVLSASGRDATISGRTALWTDILDNASRSPVVGVGFGGFWVGPESYDLFPLPTWSKTTPWRPLQGHNGFIDMYVELGSIGIMLFIIVVCASLWSIANQLTHNFEFALLRLTLFTAILLNNMAETSVLKGTHSLWFLLLVCIVGLGATAPGAAPRPLRSKPATPPPRNALPDGRRRPRWGHR